MPSGDPQTGFADWNILDASSVTPPTIEYRTLDLGNGSVIPANLYLDQIGVFHYSTSPDQRTWPSGAVWPPFPADPVQDYWVLMPFATGLYTLPDPAWAVIRQLPVIYGHILHGPRVSIPLGIKYEQLVYLPGWVRAPAVAIPVTHHLPVADAGRARVWDTSVPGPDRLQEDLRLDGSRSYDPDGGALSFSWSLKSAPPGGATLPWRTLLGSNVVALPAGTLIPDDAAGPYTFALTVSSAYGSATATVTHSLQPVNSAPVADAGPDQTIRVITGARLKQALVADASASHDPDGDPLSYTWRMFYSPGSQATGEFLLPAPVTQSQPILPIAAAGQKLTQNTCVFFGLEVAVTDPAGATASDIASVLLEVVRPEIILGDSGISAVSLETVRDPGLILPVRIERPADPDLIEADSWELEVLDRSSTPKVSVGIRPVDASDIAAGSITWDGFVDASFLVPARPGQFTLRLRALTEGIWFASSNDVDVDVVHLDISFRGNVTIPSFTGTNPSPGLPSGIPPSLPKPSPFPPFPFPSGGGKRATADEHPLGAKNPSPIPVGGGGLPLPPYTGEAHPIEWLPPTMPELTVNVFVAGPSLSDTANLEIDVRSVFEWGDRQNRRREQIPAAGKWTKLAPGQTRWTVQFDTLVGGDFTVEARATYRGTEITAVIESPTPVLGRNPDPVEARLLIGGISFQAFVYDQSRFRHFGTDAPTAFGNLVLAEPYQRENRSGITGIVEPTAEQAWNWQANIEDFRERAARTQATVLEFESAAILSGGGASAAFSSEQFALETWTRLGDPDTHYHEFDPSSQHWRPVSDGTAADDVRRRANRLGLLLATVRAGQGPEDWSAAPGPSLGPTVTASTSPETAIRVLMADASGSLDSAIAAAYGILSPLSAWELHSALDKLAGPDGTPSTAGIVDVLAAGATTVQRDPRVVAALEATRLRRGSHIVTDADLPNLKRFTEALLTLSPPDQYLILRSLGLPDLDAEGIVAVATSGDDYPAGDLTGITSKARNTAASADASRLPPFGNWNKPGDQHEAFYVGNTIHRAIAAEYRVVHAPEAGFIATNDTPVSAIVNALVQLYEFDPGEAEEILGKPDIFELSTIHYPPVIVYEIKPQQFQDLGLPEAELYCAMLNKLNVPAGLGPKSLAGTSGVVPAPDGWARYDSPLNGVITYKYFKAPLSAVKARNEKEGKQERKSTAMQRALVALGWAATASLVAALILLALEAVGGFVIVVVVFA